MSQNPYVSTGLTQDFTDEQKGVARSNIGAASESALTTLSNTVSNNTYEIAGIKSSLSSTTIGLGEAVYNVSGDALICELSACKVYCSINSTNYCNLKIVPNEGDVGADQSSIHSINGNFDGFRIYNRPWYNGVSAMYTANIPYDNNNYGTIDIDILTTESKFIHLTVWYEADTVKSKYKFYVIEEVKS